MTPPTPGQDAEQSEGYCSCGALMVLVIRESRSTLNDYEEVWICTKGESTGCPR